jgi:hypothetical protein
MISIHKKASLFIFTAFVVSFSSSQDESRRYIRVGQVQIPNSACIGGTWSTIINTNHAKTIRVHYVMTVKNVSTNMSCDALPSSITAKPTDLGTLLGCSLDVDYRIVSSEYLP